jgi:hypothetical protein
MLRSDNRPSLDIENIDSDFVGFLKWGRIFSRQYQLDLRCDDAKEDRSDTSSPKTSPQNFITFHKSLEN